MRFILKHGIILVLFVLLIVLLLIKSLFNLYADILWFNSFDYLSVLYTMVFSNLGLRLLTFFFLFAVFLTNLLITKRTIKIERIQVEYDDDVIPIKEYFLNKYFTNKRLIQLFILVSLVFAYMLSNITSGQWLTVQSYFNLTKFGIIDPVFHKDISFFVFSLPFYKMLHALFVSAIIGSAIIVGIVYFLFTPKSQFNLRIANFKQPQVHLSILVALFFALQAWNYRLNAFELIRSHRGAVNGAGYTDIVAQLPAYNILAIIAAVLAVLIFVSIFLKIYKLIIASVALLIVSSIVLGSVFPTAVQRFRVEPNEFIREQQYLERSIAYTRQAYDLEKIDIKPFSFSGQLTRNDIENNRSTIDNVRLWDYRPLRSTFQQLQTLRLYYDFNDVDIDRYWIDGEYRQVMLSARELDQQQLQPQAQTWVNQRLRYTHGYGVVMTAVNETTSEGLPQFLIKDFPVNSVSPDLEITQPGIYFGELTTNHVFANTKTKEFDYPLGNDNIETTYDGTGGVPVDSFFKRIFFAIYKNDFRLLLTGELTPASRILYDRDIATISQKLAPFIRFDKDPYLIIDEGKLYWIRDGYTITNMYPYSEPFGGINYIRNSVKIVTDAYNGTTNFYISDPEDPIIQTYAKIFSELLKPLSAMPEGIQQHIRYPSYLFNIQAEMLALYHMENPQVFYNREDAWSIPTEIFLGDNVAMEPYYTIMQLPGEEQSEYVLMLPFTPLNRSNMVSWLAARSDGDKYGKLVLFQFPKEGHIFGPMQIESRIDQDPEISEQLTLWDQRGSQILRGNLLVIPVENSIVYIEPIFLQAEQSMIPELRRVIIAYDDKIVMEKTLEESLNVLFGKDLPKTEIHPKPQLPGEESIPEHLEVSFPELAAKANELFKEAQTKQQQGDWAGYGKALKELERVLSSLVNTFEN
jgi:uncharacterized membrane protein (UPF0182 family)